MQILICDDNQKMLEILSDKLKLRYHNEIVTHCFINTFAAYTYISDDSRGNIDAAILDISIGNENGIEFAKKLQKEYPYIKIIFITSYLKYAKDIFSVEPIYFLGKPLEEEKLYEAIERADDLNKKQQSEVIKIHSYGQIYILEMYNIKYVESDKRNIYIYYKDEMIKALMHLNEIEEMLSEDFLRCHQSYLVNMNYIQKFSKIIELKSGEDIPVSRPKFEVAKNKFTQYLIGKV